MDAAAACHDAVVADTDTPIVHRARFDDLSPRTLYDLLRLRSEVFVVEQDCVFLDMDGRDHDPDAVHLWTEDEAGVTATVRLLDTSRSESSIGRVVTRSDARSNGVASALMREAIAVLEDGPTESIVLGAQAHLADWYGRFGFTVSGPGYDEDGIPHVPMRRTRSGR